MSVGLGTGLNAAGANRLRTCPGEPRPLPAGSDLIIFATTADAPHVHNTSLFAHNPIGLNISLRDFVTHVMLSSYNLVDDIDHVLKPTLLSF
jgi:hypothetical protein